MFTESSNLKRKATLRTKRIWRSMTYISSYWPQPFILYFYRKHETMLKQLGLHQSFYQNFKESILK